MEEENKKIGENVKVASKVGSDEEDEVSSDEEDEVGSDEEDEEPKLKYERICGDLQEILKTDGASVIAVNDKLLVLGTNLGRVHVLDHQGNKIRQYNVHTGPVTMIDLDANGDYFASCSYDRKVVIQGLYNSEWCHSLKFDCPVRCVAIDPHYGKPNSKKKFVVGTNQVILYQKALFGAFKTTVIYDGSSSAGEVIRNIGWKGQFMAWAVDSAVRVMDMEAHSIISLIKRDHSLALGCDQYPPHICWQDERTLLIGWGDSVKVCRIRERTLDSTSTNLDLPPYFVEIVFMFTTDFYVCGIGPLDQLVVVLAYNKSFNKSEASTSKQDKKDSLSVEWRRPQMRVLVPLQGTYEELSKDELVIRCYQEYQPVNYHLQHLNEDRRFYIVCPQDVVVAKPSEAHDRVQWLLEHERFQEALEVVKNCDGKVAQYTILNVGQAYLKHLIVNEQFNEAAILAPQILGQDKQLWEQTVVCFNNLHQLKALSRYIPTGPPGPLLSKAIYETILIDLLKADHKTFLEVVQDWPSSLYNVSLIINNVLEVLARNSNNMVLLQALAHLYSNIGKHDKALAIYLKLSKFSQFVHRLKHKDLFGLIRRHSLYSCISKHMIELMTLEADTTLQMCSQHIDTINPANVVATLRKNPLFLYKYLDMLYNDQRDYSVQYHNELIKLYAIYNPQKIMPLLQASSYIDLNPALNIVRSHALIHETVYLLIRMGSIEAAVRIVIEEQNDINWAIRICQDHSDPDLWRTLITYSIDKPDYIRLLLNNIGAHVDPLLILQCIPGNLKIPGLRDALTKIMHDYQLKISLQNGYQKILVTDCIKLLTKQVATQQTGIPVRRDGECSVCSKKLIQSAIKEDAEMVVFGCRHIYHSKCLAQEQPDFEICVLCIKDKKLNLSS